MLPMTKIHCIDDDEGILRIYKLMIGDDYDITLLRRP
jgi:hypothetical protein